MNAKKKPFMCYFTLELDKDITQIAKNLNLSNNAYINMTLKKAVDKAKKEKQTP